MLPVWSTALLLVAVGGVAAAAGYWMGRRRFSGRAGGRGRTAEPSGGLQPATAGDNRAGSPYRVLQTVLDGMDEGVSVVDADLRLLVANARFFDLLDFPRELMGPGDPFERFVRHNAERGEYGPGDPAEQTRQRVELARRFEPHAFTRTRPDGRVLEIRGVPMAGGGFVTLYRDITQQVRAEAELRANGQRFRAFAEMSADWFWETDLEQRFTYHSRARSWQREGLVDADVIGRRRSDLMAEIGATPDPVPAVTAAMAAERPFRDLEYQTDHPVQGRRWVRFSGEPMYDESGRLVGYRGTGRDVTHDKQIARDLERKEKRYWSVFMNAVEGMFRADRCGRFVDVNPAFAAMHGCPDCEAFLARFAHSRDIFVDQAVPQQIVDQVHRHGHVRAVEGWGWRADGSTFPFAQSVWAVYADDGELIGYEGIAEDTSVRQAARAALERSEQRYRIISEMTSDMVYAHKLEPDGQASLEWVAGSLDGITPMELPRAGHNCWEDIVHPDDRAILGPRLDRILAGESPIDDFRILTPNGRQRWIRVHGRAEFDPDTGRPIRILGAASDITERKEVEQRLRENAALLQHAVKIASLGHWQRDEVGDRLLYCSPELADMFGMSVAECSRELGTFEAASRYIHPEDLQRVRDVVERARRDAMAYEVAYRFYRKDGTVRYALELGEPVTDHHGRLIRTTGTLQDITAAKRSELALREAKEAAEVANRTKSEFLANMSHELRTPLNAVIGFAEVLETEVFGRIGQRNRTYARDIRDSGEHLLNIISEILDVSKAEAGMIELEESEVELAEVVKASFRLVQSKADDAGVELRSELPSELPRLYGDARRLKQVLLNLLSNAVKFTERGGHIAVGARVEPDGTLQLEVSDTGIGIAPDDLARVLEPFGQADSTMTRKHEGTGLGLPLTRSLVELHGGRFDLESTPGAGTAARIRLPAERVLDAEGSKAGGAVQSA